jgi:hypothetical protein
MILLGPFHNWSEFNSRSMPQLNSDYIYFLNGEILWGCINLKTLKHNHLNKNILLIYRASRQSGIRL